MRLRGTSLLALLLLLAFGLQACGPNLRRGNDRRSNGSGSGDDDDATNGDDDDATGDDDDATGDDDDATNGDDDDVSAGDWDGYFYGDVIGFLQSEVLPKSFPCIGTIDFDAFDGEVDGGLLTCNFDAIGILCNVDLAGVVLDEPTGVFVDCLEAEYELFISRDGPGEVSGFFGGVTESPELGPVEFSGEFAAQLD